MARKYWVSFFAFFAFLGSSMVKAEDLESIRQLVIKCAQQQKNACNQLEKLALTNQELLAKLALEDPITVIREVAVGKLTDQAVLARMALENKSTYVRQAAVDKLADPVLLAQVAVESTDEIGKTAARKLTDQAMLARVAVEGKGAFSRAAAAGKLADHDALARIAVEDESELVRRAAVDKLTDQTLLARVAAEDKDWRVREVAVDKLADQALLARLAIEDQNGRVCEAAVGKLTDQAMLERVALESTGEIREIAVRKLTDQEVLARLAELDKESAIRMAALNNVENAHPVLEKLAGDIRYVTNSALSCFARLKMATQEPRIRSRFPTLRCVGRYQETKQRYTGGVTLRGAFVVIELQQDGKMIAFQSWKSDFPYKTINLSGSWEADVRGGEIMDELFRSAAFTAEDIMELARSAIPEVRIGAVVNLKDAALLAQIAEQDKVPEVREAAKKRLQYLQ